MKKKESYKIPNNLWGLIEKIPQGKAGKSKKFPLKSKGDCDSKADESALKYFEENERTRNGVPSHWEGCLFWHTAKTKKDSWADGDFVFTLRKGYLYLGTVFVSSEWEATPVTEESSSLSPGRAWELFLEFLESFEE